MSERRSRRAKTKAINYAKEQDFSDDDIFEDSPNEEPTQKRARARVKKSTGGGNNNNTTADDVIDHGDLDRGVFRPKKTIYTEKGYDPNLDPIRERFPFLPEYEPDGSPRIDLIVGRRPVDEKEGKGENKSNSADGIDTDEDNENESDSDSDTNTKGRRQQKKGKKRGEEKGSPEKAVKTGPVEYEYLVKYKGRSYLHLEWKTGADLESMNKSAKAIYRRYLKKIAQGADEELEDPNFDPSYAVPQKIVAEAEQEFTMELSDKELLKWEKEREKELAEEESGDDTDQGEDKDENEEEKKDENLDVGNKDEKITETPPDAEETKVTEVDKDNNLDDWEDEDLDFSTLTVDKLRKIVEKDGPYYPTVEGSTNPYRDGYVTEPPKKPRASYLFFQCTMRSYFAKRNPNATQGELMTILGDQWKAMTESEQEPFIELAKEEAKQYEKERLLLEKAQKPNEVWQPIRRCLMVLDRLAGDGFATIFLEPVNTADFPDYEEVIDQPMDLGTVRKKLNSKKYQAPEQFARDVRKIWNNCKIYNRHGSAIWHVADYMSKQFERLYHAWVLEFRERYLRWSNPKARPWEHTCRQCDGKCGASDDEMVLCDHCDAMYGFKCLKPPLKKIPTGIWHCPDCKPRLKSARGTRMMSATAEQAARKRAELGDTPKRKVKQKMYLVKWAGLGYEYCTWETKSDVGNYALISEYHKLNNSFPDEPDLPESVVSEYLDKTKHVNTKNAGGTSCIPDLRSELYAQSRAFQFAKFAKEIPEKVCSECGPKTNATSIGRDPNQPKEVVECLTELIYRVSWKDSLKQLMKVNSSLPPLMTGEYDAVLPITSKGLMMNVGEIHGSVAFLGYRAFPDGSKGPAEINNIIRNVGDKIIAVDGVSTVNKSFKEVIMLLRESGKNKYAFMRFLENKYAVCDSDLSSVGNMGRYTIEELKAKFSTDRKRLMVQRIHKLLEEKPEKEKEADESDASVVSKSDAEGSEGEFEPDSDDDEMAENSGEKKETEPTDSQTKSLENGVSVANKTEVSPSENDSKPKIENETTSDTACTEPVMKESADQGNSNEKLPEGSETGTTSEATPASEAASTSEIASNSETAPSSETGIKNDSSVMNTLAIRPETTRSLAYRLLDIDVDYSSDEGGDEECAYYIDGVDDTFTAMNEIPEDLLQASGKANDPRNSNYDETKNTDSDAVMMPARRNDYNSLGERSKLVASVALSSRPPDYEDFESFPLDSIKKSQSQIKKEKDAVDAEVKETESTKRSTVKIEQVSTATNDTIHIWASAEAAAATLQIPLNEIKRVLRGDYDEDLGDEVGGFRWRYAAANATITAGISDPKNKSSKKGKEAWLEFRDRLYDPNEPHVYKNGNRLRDYQVEGVNWLASTYYRKHGCILADEMGLGKTVQIVTYLEHLYRVEKIQRPFLVVVPLSTVEHWRREFEGWTDMVCCVYHDRQRVWRDVLREYEWYYEDRPHNADFLKFDVLVTTYDTLIGDFDVISQIPFRAAVVDEAHRLRNQKGKLLECMKEISAKGTLQYGFQSRVLMSGTPLQNDLNELWTLLNFIEPYKFPDLNEFMSHFGNMANKEQVEALQKKISPYMLRRVKEDVAKDIPAKEETVIDVELTSIQKQYYRAIFEHNHAFLNMGSSRSTAPKLMNIQMELRKVCNHPCLLEGVEHREQERTFKEFLEKGEFEGKSPEEQQRMLNEQLYIMTSGKMVLMDKLLPKLRQEGHKVLVFSQMVKMLDLISEYCEFRNFPYERLDGRVRGSDRQKSIDRFERESNSFLFLLSTRAGGVGINLTAADVCIIFDSDWNPQNDVQAQARCHRIGQTKDVRIYRLITSRSFEQEMFDRASRKLGLEQAVLGSFGQDDDDDKPTNKEMEQLLKKGAYALLEDDNDEVTKAFCADDIDSILAKRTRTRVVEGTKTASWLNKQGMVVSKSKFTSDSKSADLDMDDPLFWQKVMPDFVTPSIMLQKLQDISDEILGASGKGKGRGRGRWKKKQEQQVDKTAKVEGDKTTADAPDGTKADPEALKQNGDGEQSTKNPVEADDEKEDEGNDGAEEDDGDVSDSKGDNDKYQLTRTNQRKIAKYMSDLKSMMEALFDDVDDDSLPADEKATAQKLLLTISVKDQLFNEEQRHFARAMLKRLEGNRRRRCRTSDKMQRFSPGKRGKIEDATEIREELRIVGKKVKKRRRRGEVDIGSAKKRRRKNSDDEDSGGEVGDDGYLVHSDDEADWSDIGEDLYQGKTRPTISRKEARRRRQWAADDDAATAAGRAWPALPRNVVSKVLGTLLDEVIKHDEASGGIFSVPVPRDEFPEYYEQIKNPIDYGTMKKKLESGEYRSAQAMQKDFVLVMQNCLKFNAPDSDIVQEARQQALMRPTLLRSAAWKHDLFLAEDGSVLEILDDDAKKQPKENVDGTPIKRRRRKKGEEGIVDADKSPIPRKKRGRKKADPSPAELQVDEEEDDVPLTSLRKKKPRIKISLTDGDPSKSKKFPKPREPKKDIQNDDGDDVAKSSSDEDGDREEEEEIMDVPIPRKKRRPSIEKSIPSGFTPKRRGRKSRAELVEDADGVGDDSDDSRPKKNGKTRTIVLPLRKKAGRNQRNLSSTARSGEDGTPPDFFSVSSWKLERDALDDSFESAKKHFVSRGRWKLPEELKPSKFRDVALNTLTKIGRIDRYAVFAEAVSESEAPGYYDVVENPMDMSKMRSKIENGEYGVGSEAAGKFYDDFLLMFENCSLYNEDDGEVMEEAARIFALVPETYAGVCCNVLKKQKKNGD